MLRLRLLLGILIILLLVGLCWLDDFLYRASEVRGIALFPLMVVFVVLASGEVLKSSR